MIDKLIESLLRPKKTIARWLNVFISILSALTSFYAYYLIKFQICVDGACETIRLTKIWVAYSPAYLLFGILALVLAHYLKKEKELPTLYSDSITIVLLICAMLIGLTPFGIASEIPKGEPPNVL